MLNVAIVGMGRIGNTHARCYQDHELSHIVAVCDVVEPAARQAGEGYDCPWFTSIDRMLAAGIDIDAASVTTAGVENGSDHYEPTMQLLGAGIPVLGEKPISNDIGKAREMVAAAKARGVPYAINLNHRFTPAARRAREWLDTGRLGELNLMNMTMWINNPSEASPWYHMRALHPHSIDVMRYFGGDIAKVQAFLKKGKGRSIWSNGQVNVLFENGVIGHLTGSYDAGVGYGLETFEMVGSEGRVVIHEACQRLSFYPRYSNEVESYEHLGGMQGFPDTFPARIAAWIDDLVKQTPPDQVDGKAEDALKAQLVIEAAIESFTKETVVTVAGVEE